MTDRPAASSPSPKDLVQTYLSHNFRIVTWPHIGDSKGPREKGWNDKTYTLADYKDGYRVGILTGIEIAPGQFLHDVDIDWSAGSYIAQSMLPPTDFVFGRASKRISHCFYTVPEALPSFRYEDIDKTCLIELRGTKLDGEIGMQTMAPPSVWTKEGTKEPLTFVRANQPSHLDSASFFKQRVCLSAIGMLLAKHLGTHGFGHEARLSWAGFLLKAGLTVDELVSMGEAISVFTHNTEVSDVRLVVESTFKNIQNKAKRIKGGPSLANLIGDKGKQVIKRINTWLGHDSDFVRDGAGNIIKDHQENIKRVLQLMGKELSYNEFSDKLLMDQQIALEDRQMNDMWLRIDEEYRFRPSFIFFEKVVKRLAWENGFHPVKDYLKNLIWDLTPRLDSWLITAGQAEDSAYLRAVSSIVLIAAVRRVRQPGCKYDEMLVIESKQGLNKSSALRALCPNPEWFSDDIRLNVNSQQMIEATLGKWIIEAAELAGKKKAEVEQLKSTLSRQIDGPARMAYAHLPVERPRQFILIGTTNSAVYLTDPTGARRFWPVKIPAFDVTWIVKNRDQLWAEASAREIAGESIRLHESLWAAAAEQQEARQEIDPYEDVIKNVILAQPQYQDGKTRIATLAIWEALGIPVERRDRYGANRISEIMQRLGFARSRVRPPGEGVQVGYVCEAGAFKDENLEGVVEDLKEVVQRTREPGEDDDPAPF